MQGSFFMGRPDYPQPTPMKAQICSKGLMGAVAERTLLGVLTGAEVDHAGVLGLERDRCETTALVGAIAERLGFAMPTGALVVGLAGFDEDRQRGFLRNVRRGHGGRRIRQ